jgi:membrane protease YdiL (CAAX protease family)
MTMPTPMPTPTPRPLGRGAAIFATPTFAAVWVAFLVATVLALPPPPAPLLLGAAALFGAAAIAAGLTAGRALGRQPPEAALGPGGRTPPRRIALALLLGVLVGGTLLAVLLLLARFEPALRTRLAGRAHEPAWRPWLLAFDSSILEEVTFRLLTMTVIAWVAQKVFGRRREAGEPLAGPPFVIALALSSLAFGLAHLPSWLAIVPVTPPLVVGVLLLNGAGGLVLGWVFWRWGLLAAICCHAAGDVVLQALGPRLVG